MKRIIRSFLILVAVSLPLTAAAQQGGGFFSRPREGVAELRHEGVQVCRGPVNRVLDLADESWRSTSANFNVPAGGGEGGRFDKTAVLSTKITVREAGCINAHFSAIVGSGRIYGGAPMAVFQVTLTPAGGGPRHMVGHFETPFGQPAPAIGIEAETDVDMVAGNFFQRVGRAKGDIPPGTYVVDVWWAGAGAPSGGASGSAFVLKLYLP
jgi:hypothetical protein